jgi:hypothetical protein
MPCYSRVSSTVEFGAKTDATLLAKAMESLGYVITKAANGFRARHAQHGAVATFAAGKLTLVTGPLASGPIDVNEIKRAYSAQVVQTAAKRFGWSVKQTSDTQFQVTRRI